MGTYGPFADADVDAETVEIELNVVALVRLTHAALGAMGARSHGAIVNVSSVAGYQPAPSSATYAATKAFVNSFTHAVHEEARRAGVHLMLVCPGYTHTEFHERAGLGPTTLPEIVWQSADEVAATALRDLDRRPFGVGPGRHQPDRERGVERHPGDRQPPRRRPGRAPHLNPCSASVRRTPFCTEAW